MDRPCRTARTPDPPVLSGRDQASPNSLNQIPNPPAAADARDTTMRLWQLRDCYLEIADCGNVRVGRRAPVRWGGWACTLRGWYERDGPHAGPSLV